MYVAAPFGHFQYLDTSSPTRVHIRLNNYSLSDNFFKGLIKFALIRIGCLSLSEQYLRGCYAPPTHRLFLKYLGMIFTVLGESISFLYKFAILSMCEMISSQAYVTA